MLNLDSLHVFVVAAETENFSRAAKRLHMSQPAVSQHIQALEHQLGVLLFDRHGRHIKLSPAGEALLPLIRNLIRSSRQVEEAAMALSGQVVGHLTIGCSTTSGRYVLPRLLARYREQYPLVRVRVKVGLRSQVIDGLLTGDVDVAVTSERVERSALHYRRFFQDEIVLIVPAGHPWARRESVYPNELYQERFIMREPTSGTYMALVEGLDHVGVDVNRLEIVLTLENSEAIIMAVEEGIGLGFVPRVAAERCLALGRVKVVPLEGVEMKRWLYIAINSALPQTSACRAFHEFMETVTPNNLCLIPVSVRTFPLPSRLRERKMAHRPALGIPGP